MRQCIATSGIVGLAAVVALGFGYWLGSDAKKRDQSLVQELTGIRAQISNVNASVRELAQRPNLAAVRCEGVQNASSIVTQNSVDEAVRRAFEHQVQQAKVEQEEKMQPTDENLESFARGETLITDALRAKRWTDSQAATLRDLKAHMTREQTADLMRRLAVAVNNGQLAIQTDEHPF